MRDVVLAVHSLQNVTRHQNIIGATRLQKGKRPGGILAVQVRHQGKDHAPAEAFP